MVLLIITSIFCACLSIWAFHSGSPIVGSFMAGGTVAAAFGAWRKKKSLSPPQIPTARTLMLSDALAEEQKALARSLFSKAEADYARIEDARGALQDEMLRAQLAKMQKISGRMMEYLAENPALIPSARQFSDTYQDRAAKLAEEFVRLERTGLNSDTVTQTKKKIKDTLASFDEAYEAEFERLLQARLLDVDAELDVLAGTMRAEGIAERTMESGETIGATPVQRTGAQVNRTGRKTLSDGKKDTILQRQEGSLQGMRGQIIREKVIAGALALLLGWMGAHRFYRGESRRGLLYVLFFWTGIPGLIGFVEGIRYLVMPVDDYHEQYMHQDRKRRK